MTILFKYMSNKRNIFSDGFVRLTQLSALNDPFEATFSYGGLEKLTQHINDDLIDKPRFEHNHIKYVNENKYKIGVISFSESKDNLLMWAHYADEHRGLLAGIYYDELNRFESNIFQSLFTSDFIDSQSLHMDLFYKGVMQKVNYRKTHRYTNDIFDNDYSNISLEGSERILYEIFLGKSDEWIYEKEHRIILRLEQSDRVIIHDSDFLIKMPQFQSLVDPGFITKGENSENFIIDLYKIDDEFSRANLAKKLLPYASDPKTIFMMKLDKRSIFQCVLGLKTTYNKDNILDDYGFNIDIYQACLSSNKYELDFKDVYTRY